MKDVRLGAVRLQSSGKTHGPEDGHRPRGEGGHDAVDWVDREFRRDVLT